MDKAIVMGLVIGVFLSVGIYAVQAQLNDDNAAQEEVELVTPENNQVDNSKVVVESTQKAAACGNPSCGSGTCNGACGGTCGVPSCGCSA